MLWIVERLEEYKLFSTFLLKTAQNNFFLEKIKFGQDASVISSWIKIVK